MAQESFEQLLNAVKQAESRGQRYDEKGKLLTSPKGAEGEMQVMPKTQLDPGYGVVPAKGNHPDEIARVGRDYLKAMVDKYGDTQKALIAYNWGPGNTDKWLAKGADPKVLPAETQKYVSDITGMLGGKKMRVAEAADVQDLAKNAGPGYKAALAMMFLADDKPKTDEEDIWKEAEAPVEEETAQPNAFAELDLTYQSPFAAQKQVPVQRLAGGGMPYAPTIGVKGTAREELDKIKADYDAYNAKVEAYNADNKAYADSFYTINNNPVIAQKVRGFANLGRNGSNGYKYYTADDKGVLTEVRPTTSTRQVEVTPAQPAGGRFGAGTPAEMQTVTDYVINGRNLSNAQYVAIPGDSTYTYVRTSNMAQPTAPTAPAVTQAQLEAKMNAAKADAKARQTAVNVAFDPASYGLSMNRLFSHGGVVHRADGSPESGELTQAEIEAASRPAFVTPKSGLNRQQGPISQALNSGEAYPAIARGIAETPYNVVGAPVDLATLAMRPFGYKDEKPVMGSEWIKEKMTKLGIRPGEEANPTLQGFRTAGELGASVVNPGPVAAKVGQTAEKGAAVVGKEVARQMLRGMEGEGPLTSISPPVMYAVKPRGGTFASSGSITKEPLSDFDKLLDNYLDRSLRETPDTSHDAVREFIDKKARKYFTTEYGTGDDSIRTAMRTGDMPLAGPDVERFPPYLLHAATNPDVPGHSMAKTDLERIYDKATNMDAKVLGLHNSADGDARTRFQELMNAQKERDRQLMVAEGVPNEFQNPEVRGYSLSELESYPSSTRSLKRLIEAGEQGTLPEGVKGALQRQQPIYDINEPYMAMFSPKNVAENIAVIPANKLKNMSFADAMIEGSKKMNVYRNYDAAVAKAERGGTVPKPVLEMFTKPFTKGNTGEWLQITDSRATALEGKLMNHSVGGYKEGDRYGVEYTGLPYGGKKAFDEGLVKVYSLRDDKGMPTVTLEMAKSDAGKGDKWNITQIRGRFNSEPAADQWDDIFKFIEKGEKHIGQIKQNSYNRNAAGESVSGSAVNWGSAYRDWKDGIDPTLRIQRSDNPPGWGQAEMAQGGAVERVHGDNRRYL